MKNNRVKAFTLSEMMVVLVLTAVVVGMGYAVLKIVSGTYSSYSARNIRIDDAEKLESWIRRDLKRADAVYSKASVLRLQATGDTVYYAFGDSDIIRHAARTDTFRIRAMNLQTFFAGKELPLSDTDRVIDGFNFDILLEKQVVPESFYKLYSAQQLTDQSHAIDRHQ